VKGYWSGPDIMIPNIPTKVSARWLFGAPALAVLALAVLSCGDRSEQQSQTARGGGGGYADGAGGVGGGVGGTAATGPCANIEAPLAGAPGAVGCYVHETNGWLQIPCNCELWVKNTDPAPAQVAVTFTVHGGTEPPSLDSAPAIEVAFEDPEASWFNQWSADASASTDFAIARSGDSTVVRLGATSVVLPTVSLPACTTRVATATMTGTSAEQILDLQAAVDAQGELSTSTASCINPIRP
jgi:hypothetical protein